MADKAIWAPWRAGFVLGEKEDGCVLCARIKSTTDSVENLIVHRAERSIVILNKFPYNPGHAMIVPLRHIAHLEEMTAEESAEYMELTSTTVRLMKLAFKPDSFNIGMNLGRSSGAGIPEHLHMHVVPRWHGDTNFMPVVGETKVLSVPLDFVYDALKKEFERL